MTNTDDPAAYLSATEFIDSDHPHIRALAAETVGDERDATRRALALFYRIRDGWRYSPYGVDLRREAFRASNILERPYGWCVTKSCLLAAVGRAAGLPSRVGYANVRNHIATKKLLDAIGTDIFYYHGYNEFFLNGRWVKATVAFNRQLCEKAGLAPLDWDGVSDSLYHPYDLAGHRHMEYLHDYGSFGDVPYEAIVRKFAEAYPKWSDLAGVNLADFEADVARESAEPPR